MPVKSDGILLIGRECGSDKMATFRHPVLSPALQISISPLRMNRHPKRPRSPAARHHHKAKRRRRSQKTHSPPDPEPETELSLGPAVSSGTVVALLALTDPGIVANIVHFIPQTAIRKAQSQASHALTNLVNVCRAIGPFDHALPQFFGPHNQKFWQEMLFQYYDFTPAATAISSELAVWPQLGVCYQPSEYGFLSELQAVSDRTAWPEDEGAFTLFCDLTLLVDKLATCVTASTSPEATMLLPCLLHPGAAQPRLRPSSTPPPDPTKRTLRLPVREIRRYRRPLLVQMITKDLENWGKFTDASRQVECYAGRSLRSKRWLGFARFPKMATSHLVA